MPADDEIRACLHLDSRLLLRAQMQLRKPPSLSESCSRVRVLLLRLQGAGVPVESPLLGTAYAVAYLRSAYASQDC